MTENPMRNEQGRWPKGTSGNHSGRPVGSRNKTTILIQSILAERAEELIQKAVALALEGDPIALRLCIERLFPPCKDRPIHVELPATDGTRQLLETSHTVLAAIAAGEITPNEGQMLANVLSAQIEIVNAEDIDRRLKELEQRIRSEENRDLDKAA